MLVNTIVQVLTVYILADFLPIYSVNYWESHSSFLLTSINTNYPFTFNLLCLKRVYCWQNIVVSCFFSLSDKDSSGIVGLFDCWGAVTAKGVTFLNKSIPDLTWGTM